MSKFASIAVAAVASASAAPYASADHALAFFFRGSITSIEGTVPPPPNVQVGGPLSAEFVFLRATVDAEPDAHVGFYDGAIFDGNATASDYDRLCGVNAGSIWIIDNSALGDVYRAQFVAPASMMRAQVELVDTQSAAFNSDDLAEDLSLDDFDDEFDWKTITIEVGTAESYWRIVGTIEFFRVGAGPVPCDFNRDGIANSQDLFDFLSAFFASAPAADFNHDGFINSQDYFDFLVCFLSVCR
ncbi:MAG: GC-type dockerin domain-anchored protein [Phycisphaerales bacterium]